MQIVISSPEDFAAIEMRAEKTRKGTLDADLRKMLPKHDFESAISDDATQMKGLFWNPVDVADIAWRELMNKLADAAAAKAAKAAADWQC